MKDRSRVRRMNHFTLFFCVFSPLTPHPSPLTPQQDYRLSVYWYRKAIAAGDATAMYSLSELYSAGHGVPQSDAQAAMWCERGAKGGHPPAMRAMGNHYAMGTGVPACDEKAVKWYIEAAKRGNVDCMYNVGSAYEAGRGVKEDADEAIYWFTNAADRGDAEAMCSLGRVHEGRMGTAADDLEAMEWYQKAWHAGLMDAAVLCFSLQRWYDGPVGDGFLWLMDEWRVRDEELKEMEEQVKERFGEVGEESEKGAIEEKVRMGPLLMTE